MHNQSFDLIIIGAGPGGIEAALCAAKNKLSVALISGTKIGGRATWGSLIPSKVWLASAEKADDLKTIGDFAFEKRLESLQLNLDSLRKKISHQSQGASDRYSQKLEKAGVTVILGTAALVEKDLVAINKPDGKTIQVTGKNIIIATGSGPRFTPEIKPNKDQIIAPKIAPGIARLPKTMVMAGGGVTGTEYAYAFAALGTKVTVLQHAKQLLPRLDKEVSQLFEEYLTTNYPIEIITETSVKSMRQKDKKVITTTTDGKVFESEYGFVAIGRSADLSFIDNEKIKPDLSPYKMIAIDQFGQTSINGIYAIGDVTGAPMTANRATMQARIAVHHILKKQETDLYPQTFIEAIYTNPPIAQIGDMTQDDHGYFVKKPFRGLLKSNLKGNKEGILKIKVSKTSGLILGAAGFGSQLPDLMAIMQIAINQNLLYRDLNQIPFAYPSISEIISNFDL